MGRSSAKTLKRDEIGAVSDVHTEYAHFGDFVLTKKGSLIGAVELQGRDPDGLQSDDFQGLSYLGRALYQELDESVIATQYYAHFEGIDVHLRGRLHPIADKLSRSRATFVNRKSLSSSSLVHYFEVLPSERLSKLDTASLFMHAAKAIFDADSRDVVKRHLSHVESLMCYFDELERQSGALSDLLMDVCSRWDSVLTPKRLSVGEMWAHMKFVANLDPYYLSADYDANPPDNGWDGSLADGDVSLVNIRHMDALKLHGSESKYARMLSVNRFGDKHVPWGFWAERKGSPVRLKGNYLLMMRMQNMSPLQKAFMFGEKERELNRRSYDYRQLLSNRQQSESERRELMKPAIREALEDLGEAEMVDDIWGNAHGLLVTWSTDPNALPEQCTSLKRSADRASLNTCWEGAGLSRAFKSLQPGGREYSLRDVPFTTSQFAASSLFYRPCLGQPYVSDLDDEAQYVFMGDDSTPFYYSPFIGGRGLVIGVGPIRSGKSFLKNTVASHFVKYGGSIHGLDVDEGMTPVAQSYGHDGSVFELEEGGALGFNSFAVCQGEGDDRFVQHYKNQLMMMLSSNDNVTMKTVTPEEQKALDFAIKAVIKLPRALQRLSSVVNHCPESLQTKMARWVHSDSSARSGMYARYFDSETDSIGSLDRSVVAYNLRTIKDDSIVLPIVMNEIFFRVTRLFEDPSHRHLPKFLDVDEAHVMLKIPYVLDYLVRSVRTWGKYLAGVGLWSQSPQEFNDLEAWPALRSAASTFFFMSDPQMDVDLYKRTFLLSDGECEAIRALRPKREAFIVQRELGIAKKVILEVESAQYVVSTSKPSDSVVRRRNFAEYGFDEGLRRTILDLGLPSDEPVKPDDDIEEVA